MNNKDIINKFREIVEESREEAIYDYYTNLRNTLELLEKLEKENEVLKNKQTKVIADSFHEKMAEKFDEDFIPKSKLIEALENGMSTAKGWGCEDGAYCVKEEFERLGILEGDTK